MNFRQASNAEDATSRKVAFGFAKSQRVAQAQVVYSREFDAVFFQLSARNRSLIEAKIAEAGADLRGFAHHRLRGRDEYRLRAGDYRIIYDFDAQKNILYLFTVGHRREIYK